MQQQYYPQMQPVPVPQQLPQPTLPKNPAPGLIDKSQTKIFSTFVKAFCMLVLLAGFLPFATVSCGPVFQESINGYQLAFGAAESRAAEISQGNMGLGMGMGPGQLAALNMLAGSNVLLIVAFAGTALLLITSFGLSRSRVELALALIVPAFSLAVYVHWLGLFSAFTDMFDRASEQGGGMMAAGPDIGLYAVIAFSALLLLIGTLEALGKMPKFLIAGESDQATISSVPATASPVPHMVGQMPAPLYQPQMQQVSQQMPTYYQPQPMHPAQQTTKQQSIGEGVAPQQPHYVAPQPQLQSQPQSDQPDGNQLVDSQQQSDNSSV
ncbi:MAG: hypothetical protein FWE26_00415 [Coriobacteriia bacterium]|nr:hypothetical protein [Coriobacteriia bacterium]MCL2870083.1 hypothetical protein [Coriobacteriia bacterium]